MPDQVASSNPTSGTIQNPAAQPEMATEKQRVSPAEAEGSNKGQESLQIPSRSSSKKNSTSPTSTGLSGATVSESRNSVDGRSRNSKGSFARRQRNGSASSPPSGGYSEPSRAGSQPNPPTTSKRKKAGGFLAMLGCCGLPDSANTAEGDEENVQKIETLPPRSATARAHQLVQDQPETRDLNEKQAEQDEIASEGALGSPKNTDTVMPAEGILAESKQSVAPSVTVEPPQGALSERQPRQGGASTHEDIVMADAPPEGSQGAAPVPHHGESEAKVSQPPSPPTVEPRADAETDAPEPHNWLLPPIRPEFKGKKCLVLDLDETLVHSSFKVCSTTVPAFVGEFLTRPLSDTAPGGFHNTGGNRGQLSQHLRHQAAWRRRVYEESRRTIRGGCFHSLCL